MENSVYLLTPKGLLNKTYIGFTINVHRRLRQHNREIKGGSKQTSKFHSWNVVCHITGFPTQTDARKFEWMWQHPLKSKKSRSVILQHVKGKRGCGKLASVKRKLLELSHLLPLEEHDLKVNVNTQSLFDKPVTVKDFFLNLDLETLNESLPL